MIEITYKGQRLTGDEKLTHLYTAGDRELWFGKRLGNGTHYHRIGDVIETEETKPGVFRTADLKVLRHEDAAKDEALDVAARQHYQSLTQAKKEAARSDLLEALAPLRKAYLSLPGPQRAALTTWVVRQMMGWK